MDAVVGSGVGALVVLAVWAVRRHRISRGHRVRVTIVVERDHHDDVS